MKKLFLVLMACAFMFSLVGCGGGGGDSAGGDEIDWGDKGTALPKEIQDYIANMKKAFDPTLVNGPDFKDRTKTEKWITENFCQYISPTATFMGNSKYNRAAMINKLKGTLASNVIISYEFSPARTTEVIKDKKYQSKVKCYIEKNVRETGKANGSFGGVYTLVWEKNSDDGKYYIINDSGVSDQMFNATERWFE